MSCTPKTACGDHIPFDALLKSLFLKDANGCIYLNATYKEIVADDCINYSPAVECGDTATFEQLMRKAIVLDDCGNPAINLIGFFTQAVR